MIEAVISSSLLIAIIILIRVIFKGKLKSSVRYSLWLIAAIRLMLPFELASSPISIMNFAEDLIPQAIIGESENAAAAVAHESEPYIPDGIADKSPEYKLSGSEHKNSGKISLKTVFDTIRRIISAAMLLWFAAVNIMYFSALRKNRKEFLHKAPLNIYTTPDIASPCIFGLFLPAVYIPESSANDDEAIEYIVAHELCHYYHGDLLWTVLRYVLLSVYWFDPFVWAAAILSKRDCECACDEAVIKKLGEDRRFKYGKTIIELIPQKSSESFGVISTSMASGKNVLKERMRFIASKPANKLYAAAVCAAAVIAAAGVTFTSAQDIKAPAEPVVPAAETLSENDGISQNGVSATVKDRNKNEREIIYFPAPEGYEPYIYMDEYTAAELHYPYTEKEFGQFLDGSYFSAADVVLESDNFTVTKWTDADSFDSLCNALKNKELGRADPFELARPIAQVSFSRANGGFSSSLNIEIFLDGDKKTALMTGDDMNRLTETVTDGKIPARSELMQAYNSSVHFEAVFDGEELYSLICSLSGRIENETYPPFSPDSFSQNIADKLSVSGQIPEGFIKNRMGSIVFAVPHLGSVNEIGSTFLWQNGSANFRISSGKTAVPDNAEEIGGEFCGEPCSLFINDENTLLMFSDNEGNSYCASAGFSSDDEKNTALKILGSIHIE